MTLAWIWLSRVPIYLLCSLIALLVLVVVSIDRMRFTMVQMFDRVLGRLGQEAQ